jgi:hypothetical protein
MSMEDIKARFCSFIHQRPPLHQLPRSRAMPSSPCASMVLPRALLDLEGPSEMTQWWGKPLDDKKFLRGSQPHIQ